MFRHYKVILRPSKRTDPRVGCLLGGPEDDLIRSKHVALADPRVGSVFLEGLRMTL